MHLCVCIYGCYEYPNKHRATYTYMTYYCITPTGQRTSSNSEIKYSHHTMCYISRTNCPIAEKSIHVSSIYKTFEPYSSGARHMNLLPKKYNQFINVKLVYRYYFFNIRINTFRNMECIKYATPTLEPAHHSL